MKCHIPGPNVKVLGRTIHALARFGDELFLEALSDCLVLRTINAAESAYGMIKFSDNFFTYYNHNYFSSKYDDGLKCKISMRSALHAFKSPAHMDKQVENLEIKLDSDSCKLIFQLKCKHGIVKTYFVSILDCEVMQASYKKDAVPNRLCAHHKVLSEALSSFQSADDQITIEASPSSLTLRNYIDKNSDLTKLIRTQIVIKPAEFESYVIGVDTNVTFTMKEFRAMLTFAENMNLPVQLHFETPGKPAVFIIHNGTTFEANFVLATVKPDSPTQQTDTTQATEDPRKRVHNETAEKEPRKKAHLEIDVSKILDEDSHLFDFVNIPNENVVNCNGNADVIPLSPQRKSLVRTVFKRCFELTLDTLVNKDPPPKILAENSDSE